mmetsp:Transcript_12533/g.34776  ORF Transcript_12533/g.34776 Transcript_12533/m.34776 type:complete len:177 (-) Transcript_12533:56-586(-)
MAQFLRTFSGQALGRRVGHHGRARGILGAGTDRPFHDKCFGRGSPSPFARVRRGVGHQCRVGRLFDRLPAQGSEYPTRSVEYLLSPRHSHHDGSGRRGRRLDDSRHVAGVGILEPRRAILGGLGLVVCLAICAGVVDRKKVPKVASARYSKKLKISFGNAHSNQPADLPEKKLARV